MKLFVIILFVVLLMLLPSTSRLVSSKALGVSDNKLAKCKGSPNCVTSNPEIKISNAELYVESIKYSGSIDFKFLLSAVKSTLQEMNLNVVKSDRTYFAAEAATSLGFVDDVEVYIDEVHRKIHFRSESRLGYSDLGANKRRYERFVSILNGILKHT